MRVLIKLGDENGTNSVIIQFILEMTRGKESASMSNMRLVTELSLLTLMYMIKNDKSDRSITYLEIVLFGCFRIE